MTIISCLIASCIGIYLKIKNNIAPIKANTRIRSSKSAMVICPPHDWLPTLVWSKGRWWKVCKLCKVSEVQSVQNIPKQLLDGTVVKW